MRWHVYFLPVLGRIYVAKRQGERVITYMGLRCMGRQVGSSSSELPMCEPTRFAVKMTEVVALPALLHTLLSSYISYFISR